MKLKKINAALGLLSIAAMLLHIGYTVFAYLAFYYNPTLKLLTAIPFMALACLHAVCGMLTLFLQSDGTRLELYPKQNARTILQRVSAALMLPLLMLHINTFGRPQACDYLVYFIIAFRQTGVIQGSAQNACKNGENKPKVLDFCTLAVYDNHISGQ